jgi:phospholipid N-methyltransferase
LSGLHKHIDFLLEGVKNIRATGSIARSSTYLCKHIAEKIDPAKGKVVVELGAGDGVVTKYLLERLAPDARLLVFEINDVFMGKLQNTFNDPRMLLIHDSAENLGDHLRQHGIDKADYIISGIPFLMLPDSLVVNILNACHKWLRPGGQFMQFHYAPFMLGMYRRIFGNLDVDVIPLNLPPALVVICKRL